MAQQTKAFIRVGEVNPLDGWGSGDGTQYDFIGQRIGNFKNERLLEEYQMYQYYKKCIEINNSSYEFKYDIRTVVQYKEKYIVLLIIPFNSEEINNIYYLDAQANLVWQSEDLSILYPKLKNLPYEQMGIKDDVIFASDFYGRSYKININNGKIEGCNIVKQRRAGDNKDTVIYRRVQGGGIVKPIYAENIVVAIKYDNCIEWYILDKDFCFLDYTKLEEAYRKKGYDISIDDTFRFGIKIVNELTQTLFLDNIKKYKVTTEALKKMLTNEPDYNEKLAFNPSILIDFENKVLMSHYAEPESFEYFVPDGWDGKYQNFEENIPQNQRYWIDENDRNLIRGGNSHG